MKCRRRNGRGFDMPGPVGMWHRLLCRECREARHADAMIGFGLTQLRDEPASPNGIAETLALLDIEAGGHAIRRATRKMVLRKLFKIGRACAIVTLFLAGWCFYINYVPPMRMPQPVYPTPNAFSYFKEAATHLEYSAEIGNAVMPPQRDAKPTPRIDRIKKVSRSDGPTVAVREIFDYDHLYTLADKQLLLDSNRETLKSVRAGLHYEYTDVYKRSSSYRFEYYAEYRGIIRLLRLEAQVAAARGDWYRATQSDLDATEMSIKIAHGAPLIGTLVSIAGFSIAESGLYKDIGHLNAAQSRAALTRLTAIEAERTPISDTLREEEWLALQIASDMMRDPFWRFHTNSLVGTSSNIDLSGLVYFCWPNSIMLNNIKSYNDMAVRRAALPYPAQKRQTPVREPNDPLSKIMYPVFNMAQYRYVYTVETQLALLRTTLALHAYALDHQGRYPQRLTELTPTYLPEVPRDPFNGSATLRDRTGLAPLSYHCFQTPTGHEPLPDYLMEIPVEASHYCGRNDYVLYSVGPDGKDDQGAPIDHNKNDKEHTYIGAARYQNPQEDYTGDIVAGVNR